MSKKLESKQDFRREDIEDLYSLSSMQKGLLFTGALSPESDEYYTHIIFDLCGEIDAEALKSAWHAFMEHNVMLRTGFIWEGLDEPIQYVIKKGVLILPWFGEDLKDLNLSEEEQNTQVDLTIKKIKQERFQLSIAPLFKLHFLRLTTSRCVLIWSHHHILLDGWCLPLVKRDVLDIYSSIVMKLPIHVKPTTPYRDYIAWLSEQDGQEGEIFWKKSLLNLEAPTLLANCLPFADNPGADGFFEYQLVLTLEETDKLESFAKQCHLTLNTIVQAAWTLLINSYCQREDVVFGVTVSGRSVPLNNIEDMYGLFINTLPLRSRVAPDQSVLNFLKEIQSAMVELIPHSHMPLSSIQKWANEKKSWGRKLFDTLLVFENYPTNSEVEKNVPGLKSIKTKVLDKTEYELTIAVIPRETLVFKFSCKANKFSCDNIVMIANNLRNLLVNMIQDPQRKLLSLSCLTDTEWCVLSNNYCKFEFDDNLFVQKIFETQVKKNSENIALVFENREYTYREVNEKANIVANHIRHCHGLQPQKDDHAMVGLFIERSLEMIIGVLGVLKSGCAYVPIEPSYPIGRVKFVIENTKMRLILTQNNLLEKLSSGNQNAIQVECLNEAFFGKNKQLSSDPVLINAPSDLAYVIYTSGSTGDPKGVMMEHHSVSNRALWMQEHYKLKDAERYLVKTPLGFDVSFGEILWPLTVGGCLIVAEPEGHKDPLYLMELIEKRQVNNVHFVPSMLQVFLDLYEEYEGEKKFRSVKRVFCSGEALPMTLMQQAKGVFNADICNLYGPTETGEVSYYDCISDCLDEGTSARTVPIGRPINHTYFYVLDQYQRPVPDGVPGELFIGGSCLARGYLNAKELTNEKFIPNPFTKDNGAGNACLIYKTGDLVRYLPGGNLEFLGRNDSQIKLRGQRIELSEIESALCAYPNIKQSVVLVSQDKADNEMHLIAYYLSQDPLDGLEIVQYLQEKLPEYMIPSALTHLKSFPLTSNGKLDIKGLPKASDFFTKKSDFVQPKTITEAHVISAFSDVLGCTAEALDASSCFFDLGGTSLSLAKLTSRINKKFSIKLSFKEIFSNSTIYKLAKVVDVKLDSEGGS